MIPVEGSKAPQFKLKDGSGRTVKLSDFKGKRVVLYFYPRDMTPGCTIEACEFRDDANQFAKRNAVVLGVSTDDEASHRKFSEKYSLPFPLLADTEHEMAESYGVWQEKNMYGKKTWGVKRATFVIDENVKIARVFPSVKPEGHSKQVLDALDGK